MTASLPPRKKKGAAAPPGARRILIIEDERPLLELLRDTFRKERFEVIAASNGREGIELAFRIRPHLILLDILMPDIDGLDVLKRIRRDRYKWGKYVPIILLSNLSHPDIVTEGLKRYADDYLVKADWTLSELVKRVKEKMRPELPARPPTDPRTAPAAM